MGEMDEDVGRIEGQLRDWGEKVDELVAESEDAVGHAKTDLMRRIHDLKAKHRAALSKLDELKTAKENKADSIKVSVEIACKDLESAYREFTR